MNISSSESLKIPLVFDLLQSVDWLAGVILFVDWGIAHEA